MDDNIDAAESSPFCWIDRQREHIAHDGLEALEAAATWQPDLVLLDIGLPKLNGYEVARKIRAERWGQGMVLVALTGWNQDEDRRKSKDFGFDGHLVKPVDHAALMRLLADSSAARTDQAADVAKK